tara:strand:- start:11232 stop:11450 length:219 start_codon:yes stop_codon:yes gene_type:complete
MKFGQSNWRPSQEQNVGIISNTYNLIKKELFSLQEETNCPDEFVYKFVGAIQKEWHKNSCHSKARKFRDKHK